MSKITVKKLPEPEVEGLGIRDWPIWEKEVSRFDWKYEETEECLVLEGAVDVITPEETVSIGPGDFVRFEKGLICVWDVKKPIRKHYNFL